jgi:dGTPase
LDRENDLLAGVLDMQLVKLIPSKDTVSEIKRISKREVYSQRRVVEIEAAGFGVASGLLDLFLKSIEDAARRGESASSHSKKFLQLLPEQVKGMRASLNKDPYNRLMSILDYYSGMTDSFAVSIFKKVSGISLPEH